MTPQIPAKYAKLKQAEAAGLITPKSLLLHAEEVTSVTSQMIHRFVSDSNNNRFIVRSAHLAEDANERSLAGHFWSSEPVQATQINATIQKAQQENAAVLVSLAKTDPSTQSLTAPPLILQEYIEHSIGGVLFCPWSFFSDYAYVEYSTLGVKEVVEGHDGVSGVLSLSSQYIDPLALGSAVSYLRSPLMSLCCQLRESFDFPVDCEWAYDQEEQQVVVLQVRPQTHQVGPVLPYSMLRVNDTLAVPADHSQASYANVTHQWQFTALSESLGRLSPLSFSLIQQLYHDSIPMFRALGCKAGAINFIKQAPDGTVLVNPELENHFYSMTLFGGFKRGIAQAKFASEAHTLMTQYMAEAPFSYDRLKQLFVHWMGANLLSEGMGRCDVELVTFKEPVHAYELSWPTELEAPAIVFQAGVPLAADDVKQSASNSKAVLQRLKVLNAWGRALFLFELNKLKWQLIHPKVQYTKDVQASLYFTEWTALHHTGLTPDLIKSAKAKQHALAPQALYDYAMSGGENSEIQALSSTKPVKGELLVIANPATAKTSAFEGYILIAPYFDNRWVSQIKWLKGIVVGKGSHLSHSAIVAREYKVPYYVVPNLDVKRWDQGQIITLDPATVSRLSY